MIVIIFRDWSKATTFFWQFIEIELKNHRLLPLQICGLWVQLGFHCLLAILFSTRISHVSFSSKLYFILFLFNHLPLPIISKLSDKNLYCFLPPISKLKCNYTLPFLFCHGSPSVHGQFFPSHTESNSFLPTQSYAISYHLFLYL